MNVGKRTKALRDYIFALGIRLLDFLKQEIISNSGILYAL